MKNRNGNALSESYSDNSDSMPKHQVNRRRMKNIPKLEDSELSESDDTSPGLPDEKQKVIKKQSKNSIANDEYDYDETDLKKTKNPNVFDHLETGDDDDIEDLLGSSAVAANVSKKIPSIMEDSDDYSVETEINAQISTDHKIPPMISSDSYESDNDQINKIKSKIDQNSDDRRDQIDYKEAHKVFDRLNKLYKNGDEPVWETIPKEPTFNFSPYVTDKISELKKNNTGKILLDDIRNSK